MALYNKSDFARYVGLTTNNLAVYIARKKIVVSEAFADMIDDADPKNLAFIQNRMRKGKMPTDVKPPIPEIGKQRPPSSTPFETPGSSSIGPGKNDAATIDEIENELRKVKLEKDTAEAQLARMKLEKASGEVIPTDLVKSLFTHHAKSITVEFHNAAGNLVMEISKIKSLTPEEIAKLRGQLIIIINKAADDAVKNTTAGIKNIQNEYAERRGVGEKR